MNFGARDNSAPNIWATQERVVSAYRMMAAAALVTALLLSFILAYQLMQSPVVVERRAQELEFYPSSREVVVIGTKEVENFAKSYLASLFVWNSFDVNQLAAEVIPFSEPQLVPKIGAMQSQRYLNDLKSKKLKQAITFLDVQVLSDRVLCHFDRILKIDSVPLVIPTEITLFLIRGRQTRTNPTGIYVSTIVENNSAR